MSSSAVDGIRGENSLIAERYMETLFMAETKSQAQDSELKHDRIG